MMYEQNFGEKIISLYETLIYSKYASRKTYEMLIMDVFAIMRYLKTWRKIGLKMSYEPYMVTFQNMYLTTRTAEYRDFILPVSLYICLIILFD